MIPAAVRIFFTFEADCKKEMHPKRLICDPPEEKSGGLFRRIIPSAVRLIFTERIERRKMRPKRLMCDMDPPEENSGRNCRNIFVPFF
jgi:hypothetical protein